MKIDGEKLKDLMIEHAINPKDLATKAGVSLDVILRTLKGKIKISKFQTVGRLSKTFNVKPQELLIEE